MKNISRSAALLRKADWVLTGVLLPAGFFALLTGMFWIGDHGLYSKLFYWLQALPVLLLLAVDRRPFRGLLESRIFLAYLPFACYMALSVFWSAGEDSAVDLLKRPLYVVLLFCAVFEFGRRRFDLFCHVLKGAAFCAVISAVYALVLFFNAGGEGRLAGYGALDNPLLVSHVYGFFLALWLGILFAAGDRFDPLALAAAAILVSVLVATGSRTPLLAMSATIVWLSILRPGRKGVLAVGVILAAGGLILLLKPEILVQRGLSYRTDIWFDILRQIAERPWFGNGFGTPVRVRLDELAFQLHDPHNLTLAVIYAGGVVGGVLWLALYGVALVASWRFRRDGWVVACAATMVYGLTAGMMEGGSFLSRPKEHWFLIWIPLALLSAVMSRLRTDGRIKPGAQENWSLSS